RIVWRQPFPGPGLAIRVVGGAVTQERLDILREADAILQEEIRAAGLYRELWQSFCVLPAVKSVGVQGDERTYAYPIVIRAVTSDDAMTADWARLPYDLLEKVSSRIINEIRHVNRVALDISSNVWGLVIGLIARLLLPGRQSIGLLWTIVLGIGGAVIGGLLATALGVGDADEFDFGSFLIAVATSMLLLYLVIRF